MTALIWLDDDQTELPNTALALDEPAGLLAAGGNLEAATLQNAYYHGVFPWFNPEDPILWWFPPTRAILLPEQLTLNRTNKKLLRQHPYQITTNRCFENVIESCAATRLDNTWIDQRIKDAYLALHRNGQAHSVEVWLGDKLVGGLYGVQVGAIFCGESMFNFASNSSKIAFFTMVQTLFNHGFEMIDAQIQNPFLASLGILKVPKAQYESALVQHRDALLTWPRF